MTSPDEGGASVDGGRRFGKTTWMIIGGIITVAIAFAVMVAFGSLITSGTDRNGTPTETAEESATSGPGHDTTSDTEQSVSSNTSAFETNQDNSTIQMPDSEITYGRETDASN